MCRRWSTFTTRPSSCTWRRHRRLQVRESSSQPGGGNTELNVGTEGTDVAAWLNGLGISAFILRYRLQPYSSASDALADTERAVRLIRANAAEWGVDRAKLGIMGFSAGGEQAARLALNFDAGDPASADPVERESSRPDFVVLVYAGWGRLDMSQVPKNAPPAFLTSAGIDDAFHARQTVEFYNALFNANVPVELHIYGHGGHANGIKPRDGIPFGTWHLRFLEWLTDLQKVRPHLPRDDEMSTARTENRTRVRAGGIVVPARCRDPDRADTCRLNAQPGLSTPTCGRC